MPVPVLLVEERLTARIGVAAGITAAAAVLVSAAAEAAATAG
jgi:hypothetical protein